MTRHDPDELPIFDDGEPALGRGEERPHRAARRLIGVDLQPLGAIFRDEIAGGSVRPFLARHGPQKLETEQAAKLAVVPADRVGDVMIREEKFVHGEIQRE